MREGTGDSTHFIPLPEFCESGCVCVCPGFRCVLFEFGLLTLWDTLQFFVSTLRLCASCVWFSACDIRGSSLLSALLPLLTLLPAAAPAMDAAATCSSCNCNFNLYQSYQLLGLQLQPLPAAVSTTVYLCCGGFAVWHGF